MKRHIVLQRFHSAGVSVSMHTFKIGNPPHGSRQELHVLPTCLVDTSTEAHILNGNRIGTFYWKAIRGVQRLLYGERLDLRLSGWLAPRESSASMKQAWMEGSTATEIAAIWPPGERSLASEEARRLRQWRPASIMIAGLFL